MKLKDELPSWVSVGMRVIAYGVLVSIVFVVLFGYSKAKQTAVVSNCAEQVSVRDGAQSYAEEMSTCLAQNNDLFGTILSLPINHLLSQLPSNPPEFVGVWIPNTAQQLHTGRVSQVDRRGGVQG